MTRKQKKLKKNLRKIRYTIAQAAEQSDKFIVTEELNTLEAEALRQEGYIIRPWWNGLYSIVGRFENPDDFYFNNTRAKKEWREAVTDAGISFCPCCGQRLR